MSYGYYRRLKRPYIIAFLSLIAIFFIIEKVSDYYHEKDTKRILTTFHEFGYFIDKESAYKLLDYKSDIDSAFILKNNASFEKINSKYKLLFEKLSLGENVKIKSDYIFIKIESKDNTEYGIMLTGLLPEDIYENSREFIHFRTLFSENDSLNIYMVRDVLMLE
jgi:hypothetical protein